MKPKRNLSFAIGLAFVAGLYSLALARPLWLRWQLRDGVEVDAIVDHCTEDTAQDEQAWDCEWRVQTPESGLVREVFSVRSPTPASGTVRVRYRRDDPSTHALVEDLSLVWPVFGVTLFFVVVGGIVAISLYLHRNDPPD